MTSNTARFEEAIALLDEADRILNATHGRIAAKVAELKSTPRDQLSAEDQRLLDAQLAHEARMLAC